MRGFKNLTPADKEIVLALAENNMCVSRVAKNCNYHRNSVAYHLESVRKKTKLDPYNFYDLIELVTVIKKEGAV